ncbi:MAG: transketolase family protein [Candidatus Cloacimonadota bacterium]|nr:transketolase family protein [Candidatus Cloacimonadota bacterium]
MKTKYTVDELKKISKVCKSDILTMTTLAASGHPGGSISSLDIYLAIYDFANISPENIHDPSRDRIVISHGHTAPGIYSVLGRMGFFDIEHAIAFFRKAGSIFEGHVEPDVPGIEWATGNLGQGLSAGIGFALAGKQKEENFDVFVVMGDGEQQKGQISEARRFAVKYGLNNITGIVDYNRLQISGNISKVMQQNVKGNYESDGWKVIEINGHDFNELLNAFQKAKADTQNPTLILAYTTMGNGISFMENDETYHGKPLSEDQYAEAMKELGLKANLSYFKNMRKNFTIPPNKIILNQESQVPNSYKEIPASNLQQESPLTKIPNQSLVPNSPNQSSVTNSPNQSLIPNSSNQSSVPNSPNQSLVPKPTDQFLVTKPQLGNVGKRIIYKKGKVANRNAYGEALYDLAKANKNIPFAVFDCDLAGSVRTNKFAKEYPHAFYQSGIQEHNTAVIAGVVSKENIITFFSDFGVFGVDETYNQQRLNDINKTNLKLVTTHVGLDVGEDGKTHQCIDYIGLMRNLYGFKIIIPADANQTDQVIRYIAFQTGNYFIPLGRSKTEVITAENGKIFYDENHKFDYGKVDELRQGKDGALLATGVMVEKALQVHKILKGIGIEIAIWNFSSLSDISKEDIKAVAESGKIFTYEDHNVHTGLGSIIASKLLEFELNAKLKTFGASRYGVSGKTEDVFKYLQLDAESIAKKISDSL